MTRPRIIQVVLLAAVIVAVIQLIGCGPPTDPVDVADLHYQKIINLLHNADPDVKAKKNAVEEYWTSHEVELLSLQKQMEAEMNLAKDAEEKANFVHRYEKILNRIKEIQKLLRENGIEL